MTGERAISLPLPSQSKKGGGSCRDHGPLERVSGTSYEVRGKCTIFLGELSNIRREY